METENNVLSNIPLPEIHVGMKVKSLNTNNIGEVVKISDEIDRDDYTITIKWETGYISNIWHFWLTSVIAL